MTYPYFAPQPTLPSINGLNDPALFGMRPGAYFYWNGGIWQRGNGPQDVAPVSAGQGPLAQATLPPAPAPVSIAPQVFAPAPTVIPAYGAGVRQGLLGAGYTGSAAGPAAPLSTAGGGYLSNPYLNPTNNPAPATQPRGFVPPGTRPVEANPGYNGYQSQGVGGGGQTAPVDPLKNYKDLAAFYGINDWGWFTRTYLPNQSQATHAQIIGGIEQAWKDGQWSAMFQEQMHRPPNDLEWKEHAIWTQTGGRSRDPLLGIGKNEFDARWNALKMPNPPGTEAKQYNLAPGAPSPSAPALTPPPAPSAPPPVQAPPVPAPTATPSNNFAPGQPNWANMNPDRLVQLQ